MSELKVENLIKVFSHGRSKHVVLNDVNFTVNHGEFLSLLGPSGCGKTTLLSIIAGFSRASGGRVVVGETLVSGPGPDRAVVFQNYALFPWMTLKDNILYPMKLQRVPPNIREERLRELLALAKLDGKENLYPYQLSGGMKQRTAVIRALACRPRLLLMDEPLGAVDVQMRHKLQEDLESIFLKDPVTVIMVTHDIEEAVYLSDRVIVMSACEGRIIADVPIRLKRPRQRRSRQYYQIVCYLMDILHNDQGEGVSKGMGTGATFSF